MSPAREHDSIEHAARLVAHSRIAAIAAELVSRWSASARSSRAIGFATRWANEFRSLTAVERTRCALIVAAVALAGHVVMAALLPASARPTLGLSALALFGAGLASVSRVRRK